MVRKGLTSLWSFVLLAGVIPGIHLHTDVSSTQPAAERLSDSQIYRPVLQPSEAIPSLGTYMLKSLEGNLCIKAIMGAEYIIIEKQKTWYFNLDPSRVRTSGYCEKNVAVLSLTLPDNAASLQFTFKKAVKRFYVTSLSAHVSPLPVCQKCSNKTYSGLQDHDKLFKTNNGESFTCKSENVIRMSSQLKVKLVSMQMQAFTLPDGQFGKEMECWADFNRRVIPIIIGATVVGLVLIALLTFLLKKDHLRQGYERI